MSVPECSKISFISSASLIRYEGIYVGFDAVAKKLKASSLRVCGSEDRLPEAEKKPASNLLLKEIEVEVDTIIQLHAVGHGDTTVVVRDRSSKSALQGTLVAYMPGINTLVLSNCKVIEGSETTIPNIIKVDTQKADISLASAVPKAPVPSEPDCTEEEDECPLCLEPYDVTDQRFAPCSCGYRLCIWCFHTLQESTSLGPTLCPNCRAPYSQNKLKWDRPDAKQLQVEIQRQRRQQNPKRYLPGVLVVCRNLVSLTGLPQTLCKAKALRQHQWLGQYGRILTLTVNAQEGTAQALFQLEADASTCVKCVDGITLEEQVVRAYIGVTKYCPTFLKGGAPCNQSDCTLLHSMVDESLICLPLHVERQKMAPPPQRSITCQRSLPPPSTLEPGIPEPLDARAFDKPLPRNKGPSPSKAPSTPSPDSMASSTILSADTFRQLCDELFGHELYDREVIYSDQLQEWEDLVTLRIDVFKKLARPKPPPGLFLLNSAELRGRAAVSEQQDTAWKKIMEQFNAEHNRLRVWRQPPVGPPPEHLRQLEEEEKRRRWQERNERLKKEYLEQQQRRREQEEQQKQVREPPPEPEVVGKGQGKGKGAPRLPQPTLFDYLKGNKQVATVKPAEAPPSWPAEQEENVQLQRPQNARRPGAQYAFQQESSAVTHDVRLPEDLEDNHKRSNRLERPRHKDHDQDLRAQPREADDGDRRQRSPPERHPVNARATEGKGGKGMRRYDERHSPETHPKPLHRAEKADEESQSSSDEGHGRHAPPERGGKGGSRPSHRLYDPDEEYYPERRAPEWDEKWGGWDRPKERPREQQRRREDEEDWDRGKGYGASRASERWEKDRSDWYDKSGKGEGRGGRRGDPEDRERRRWQRKEGGESPQDEHARRKQDARRCHMDNYDEYGKPVAPEYVSPKEEYYAKWGYEAYPQDKGWKDSDWWETDRRRDWGRGGDRQGYGHDYGNKRGGNRWWNEWEGWEGDWDNWGTGDDSWGQKGKRYDDWENWDAWGYERGGYYEREIPSRNSRKEVKERSDAKGDYATATGEEEVEEEGKGGKNRKATWSHKDERLEKDYKSSEGRPREGKGKGESSEPVRKEKRGPRP